MFRALLVCAVACAAASAAKKQCSTKCTADDKGDSVLTFTAADLALTSVATNDQGVATDATVALAKALRDLETGKVDVVTDLNQLMDDVAFQYAEDLQKVNDENNDQYGNFMDNHEDVVAADQLDVARMEQMKTSSQECQSKFQVLRTKETDEVLSGWDHADEDGLTELEGDDMGDIAEKYKNNQPSDAGADCLPVLINKCQKAQITDKTWGYDYDFVAHEEQESAEEGTGHVGLARTTIHRHFVNDECPNIVGSSCNTACPLAKYEHYVVGADVMYTCGADGDWKAELKKYSKIKVFTHVAEQELDEWAAYQGIQVDDTFLNAKWPKMLNLDVDLEDHDPIATLQSYLNYRGIACDVWDSKFVDDDATDPNKITKRRTKGDADGAAIFLTTGDNTTASTLATAGELLRGTDYVEIPPHLCSSKVRTESGENGGAYTIPGKYNFKVKGGKKVPQVVFTNKLCHGGTWSNTYADKYDGVGGWNPEVCQTKLLADTSSHGGQGCSPDIFGVSYSDGRCWCVPKSGRWRAATEDCDSFDHGTSHTWKFVQGTIDAPATLDCDNKYVSFTGEELAQQGDYNPNFLVPAGTGSPKKFAKRNSDPNYGANKGWFFRIANDDGTAWEYVKQGMDGDTVAEDGAEAAGWSSDKILKTTNGLMHGPFSPDDFARSTPVHKTFTIPVGATSCTVSFRYMRQWTWDHEYGYMHINDKQVWSRRGAGACNTYEWRQWPNDMPGISGNANQDCYYDAVIQNIPCPAGEDFKVGFSSNINSGESDESWGFTNFNLHISGVPGDIAGLTVHHFDVEKEGSLAPNGKTDNFDWAYSATQAELYDCVNTTDSTYAHTSYASYENLEESCGSVGTSEIYKDERVSLDKIVAWWKMESFDEKKWEWESIVEHYDTGEKWKVDFISKGDLKVAMGGEGSHDEYMSLEGNTDQNAKISWGNVVMKTNTLCTTSMWTASGSTGRVFRGARSNWFHGHWGSWSRSHYFDGWVNYGPWVSNSYRKRDWLITCTDPGTTKAMYYNLPNWNGDYTKVDDQNYRDPDSTTGRWDQRELIVGRCGRTGCGSSPNEESGFRVSEVIAWNRAMSRDELKLMVRYLMERLRGDAE